MAKVTGPLFSMDARGKFGGALVFTNWKGRPVVRELVIPGNPKTAPQETSRNRISATAVMQHQLNLSTQKQTGQTKTDKAILQAAAPTGQAWNGYLTKLAIGAGDLTDTAAETAYQALTSGNKTTWDTAAAARVPAFTAVAQKGAGGSTITALTAGHVYFKQQYALYAAGLLPAPVAGTPPTYA